MEEQIGVFHGSGKVENFKIRFDEAVAILYPCDNLLRYGGIPFISGAFFVLIFLTTDT